MRSRDPVVIVEYDPAWPASFAGTRDRLAPHLPPGARIEHVGSTAVPGLAAKPIVDVMVGVAALAEIEACIPRLEADGWEYVAEHEVVLPERRFLARPTPPPRTHHLHAVQVGTPFWNDHLVFRDQLRADAGLAAEYAALKRRLAERHGEDRAAYTEAKGAFIGSVLAARR